MVLSKMCPDRVCLRGGDQPATPGHSIPRQAAREARRQEPPRWQRTRGGLENWQLRGEKRAQGTGGLSRRAETPAQSTREGRRGRKAEKTRAEEEPAGFPSEPLCIYKRDVPRFCTKTKPSSSACAGAVAHRQPRETELPSGRGCHDTRRLHSHSGRALGEPGHGALLLRVRLWIWF